MRNILPGPSKHCSPARKEQANLDIQRTLDVIKASDGSVHKSAEILGVSLRTLRDRLQRAKLAGMISEEAIEALQFHARREANQHFSETRSVEGEMKGLEEKLAETEKQRDVLLALEGHKASSKIPTYNSTKSNAVPILVLSDLHMEERVDPKQVAGCDNEYNPEIAKARLQKVFQHGLFMTNVFRGMAKIDTFCLAILGDLLTGHIHEELAETNYMTPIEASVMVEEELGKGIEYLLSKGNFSKIIIPTACGNHGRDTFKTRAKDGAEHSYEYLIYKMLAKNFRNEKRLDWHIATGYHNYVKIHNSVIRFHHGDAVAYGGGVGGVTIPIRKAIANWNTITPAQLTIQGHFHELTDGGDFIVNGSLIGFNEYSLRIKARFERPRQALVLIDSKRGKTLTAEVFTE